MQRVLLKHTRERADCSGRLHDRIRNERLRPIRARCSFRSATPRARRSDGSNSAPTTRANATTAPSLPRDVVLTTKAWKDLVRVNKWVNDTIQPITDMDQWGVVEKWSYPDDGRAIARITCC